MDFVSLSSHACPTDSFQVLSLSHLLPFTLSTRWREVHQAVSAQYPSFPSKSLNILQAPQKKPECYQGILKSYLFQHDQYIGRQSKNLMQKSSVCKTVS